MAVLKNVEIFWAKLDPAKPAEPFGQLQWELQARTRDKDVAKTWKNEMSLNVKMDEDDNGTFYRTNLKKKAKNMKGDDLPPPTVVDASMQPLDGTIVGNGSIGNIQIKQKEYEMAGQKGISSQLFAVQITKLVEYKGGSGLEFEIMEGGTEVVAPAATELSDNDDDLF